MKILIFKLLFTLLLLLSCSQKNEIDFFSSISKIAENYKVKIENLQKKLAASTDLGEGRKISLDILKLKDEAEYELKNHFSAGFSEKSILFNQDFDRDIFEIQSIKVENISYNKLDLTARILSKKESNSPLFSYLRFIDDKGNEIPGWIVLISPMSIKSGEEYLLKGSYSGIEKLQKASKIIVKSRNDYENSTSFGMQ